MFISVMAISCLLLSSRRRQAARGLPISTLALIQLRPGLASAGARFGIPGSLGGSLHVSDLSKMFFSENCARKFILCLGLLLFLPYFTVPHEDFEFRYSTLNYVRSQRIRCGVVVCFCFYLSFSRLVMAISTLLLYFAYHFCMGENERLHRSS